MQQGAIGLSERFLELSKPIVGGYRTVVRPVEHARFPSPAVCAAFFLRWSLYPFGTMQEGREEISPIPIATASDPGPAGRAPAIFAPSDDRFATAMMFKTVFGFTCCRVSLVSCRSDAKRRIRNLEIPGSRLRRAPE
jgi:hypothetical protein